jgi:hypothetical protein
MRVWNAQPKVMAAILSNPVTLFDVRTTSGTNGLPVYTVAALQTSPAGAPLHTAIACYTDLEGAERFAKSSARALVNPVPTAPRKPAPAKFSNGLRLKEAA